MAQEHSTDNHPGAFQLEQEPFALHAPLSEIRAVIHADVQTQLGAAGVTLFELNDLGLRSPRYYACEEADDGSKMSIEYLPLWQYDTFYIHRAADGQAVRVHDADFHGSRVHDFKYFDKRPSVEDPSLGTVHSRRVKADVMLDPDGQLESPGREVMIHELRTPAGELQPIPSFERLEGAQADQTRQTVAKQIVKLLEGMNPTANSYLTAQEWDGYGRVTIREIDQPTIRQLRIKRRYDRLAEQRAGRFTRRRSHPLP